MKYWQKKGAEITIFTTKDGKSFYEKQISGLTFEILDFTYSFKNPYQLIGDIFKINLLALTKISKFFHKYDIVYSQSAVIDFLLVPFLLRLFDKKIRWFVMVDNTVPAPGKRPGSYLRQLLPFLAFHLGNFLLKKADGIFVVTNNLQKYYQKRGYKEIIKTGDGYGIETEIFTGKISATAPVVDTLFAGRLHLAKGILDLVEVIVQVVKSKPGFKTGILGDGEEDVKKIFLDKIKKHKLTNNFQFFGYRTGKEKGDIFRNCGFFLFLSYDESFGHAILEALACNKLVLAYDLPIYHEVFAKYLKSRQLILFPIGDTRKVGDYISTLPLPGQSFHNQLADYSWDTISENEFRAFTKK